MQMLLQCSNPK